MLIGGCSDKILSVNRVAFLLHRLARELERAGDRILRAEVGLSYSRALVLLAVEHEGPMSQQDLASWVGSTEPAVSSLLRELTPQELVAVREDENNRRRNVVSLTPEGQLAIRSARVLLERRFEDLASKAQVDSDLLFAALTERWTNLRVVTPPDIEPNIFAGAVRRFDLAFDLR